MAWKRRMDEEADHGALLCSGYLYKRSSGVLKRWQKRYFAVVGKTLTYRDAENDESHKAVLDLHHMTDCKIDQKFITLSFSDGNHLELQVMHK